ncbi:hypothetical protein PRtIB026_A23320 [Pseudomonas sp. RtIB026]|uniref:polymorphic toxin type 44 domain-containing protein n=1 Tax=Pseudomonas sp. RtIB026 TaxID=2749999 RepID=UPI00226E2952|nr:polymorphic toxin type 44 domain-containing protein [Pseudomonas sp. RtIB026]BDU09752.1 hypothetical protein PRtIB026_A23320 [Pseudomonas sp. RtIB026]
MPVELPATVITGRRPDFSPVTVRPVVEPMDPRAEDTLARLIRASEYVEDWMSKKWTEIGQQHDNNMAAIDAELDKDIKDAGGLNTPMDLSTPASTVTKEKNIVVKLYLTKQSSANEKSATAKALFDGDVLAPRSATGLTFARANGYQVRVDQLRLANWANSLQAARLAQVYTEMVRRLQVRAGVLGSVESAQATRAANELNAAREQIRLKQYPAAPPGVSLAQNLEESKKQKEHFKNGGTAFLFSWFYAKVRNRGDWDYKQRGRQFASFGNFNYGAVGAAAGISEAVLLRAAGAAQTVAGTSQAEFDKWWADAPYGDDPVDQAWIKAGIDYAKSQGY